MTSLLAALIALSLLTGVVAAEAFTALWFAPVVIVGAVIAGIAGAVL